MICVGKWKIFLCFLVCANPARRFLARERHEQERRRERWIGLEKLPAKSSVGSFATEKKTSSTEEKVLSGSLAG